MLRSLALLATLAFSAAPAFAMSTTWVDCVTSGGRFHVQVKSFHHESTFHYFSQDLESPEAPVFVLDNGEQSSYRDSEGGQGQRWTFRNGSYSYTVSQDTMATSVLVSKNGELVKSYECN